MEKVKKLEHCPLCNKFGTDVSFAFWCTNEECQNYKNSWDNSSEYKKCDCKSGGACNCDEQCDKCKDKKCPPKPKVYSKRSGGCTFDQINDTSDALDAALDGMGGGD